MVLGQVIDHLHIALIWRRKDTILNTVSSKKKYFSSLFWKPVLLRNNWDISSIVLILLERLDKRICMITSRKIYCLACFDSHTDRTHPARWYNANAMHQSECLNADEFPPHTQSDRPNGTWSAVLWCVRFHINFSFESRFIYRMCVEYHFYLIIIISTCYMLEVSPSEFYFFIYVQFLLGMIH